MRWRIIIKVAFNDDKGSRLRNRVAERLQACGIKCIRNSGTWEGPAVSPQEVSKQLASVFPLLSDPRAAGIRRSRLDHLWIYIDRSTQ
jgi:hypothetical protein